LNKLKKKGALDIRVFVVVVAIYYLTIKHKSINQNRQKELLK